MSSWGRTSEGKLTAYCNDFVVDKGAYYSIGHVVVHRALLMLSGSYHIPNVACPGRLVYTNNPWGSAARGAGPPQANFALECAMDMLAEKTRHRSLRIPAAEFAPAGPEQIHRPGRHGVVVPGTDGGDAAALRTSRDGRGTVSHRDGSDAEWALPPAPSASAAPAMSR